ncbi:1-phosphatidylinositol 4,5-bisphosphate phosphodiesterase zeta-1-like isoform X4 [Argiope bruennichi]|uniref:1-phosphatidylinositol 4,5-bisphosphate phosphodiesterase zeta-1-like isoform X4 n=1 Tax=Argiope bruennichi TaxID=94029 RepID=UPI002494312D|nr:1-phosphatidylinositol 4,5-bisphosphate phosphodiesterase zeta-1-like isoform X4 [Argiope bruennichi]
MEPPKKNISIGEAMPLQMIIKGMTMGTVMYKVKTSDKWYRRKYKVDIQNMRLSYAPSSKPFWRGKITSACKCGSFAGSGTNIVDLFDLEEVRKGWNSDVFNKLQAKFRRKLQKTLHPQLLSKLHEENCFSLIIGPAHYVVDLIAPNIHARDAWVRGLRQLMACCKHMQVQHDEERWLKELVRKADVNGNGSLNFEECLGLLNQLNIGMRRKEARKLFNAANFRKVKIEGEDALEPDEFVQFYRSLVHRPELEELMKKYSVSKSVLWGSEELRNFLQKEQNMILSMEECEALIEEYEPEDNKISGYLSLEGFQQFLLSPDQDIFNKKHRIIYQDMTQPLAHYYIASSHNTYLISGQLIGDSSIEGYIQALGRGCRCLELDTWDGPDGEPIIFHGYTLTSRIFLRDVLEAIKKYAFRASQYPVILSIENHCSLPYQVKMAEHFRNILGKYLYTDPVGDDEEEFPSPEALARKIFIKSKQLKPPRLEDGVMMAPEEFMLEDEEEREEAIRSMMAAAPTPDLEGNELPDLPMAAPSHAPRIAEALSDLVNYFSAKRFGSFSECRVCWQFNEMSSFSETVALNLAYSEGEAFVAHNRRHVSRIYPKGTRTDSTNYDPVPYWSVGCQLVALNYQTWDEPMYIHEAKFSQNGKCGYVLKPKYLTDKASYDPSKSPYPDKQLHVTIKIISAQFLPKPNRAEDGEVVDPYVSVKVYGHPLDAQKKKTKFISNNGFNPMWNQTLKFVINAPEEAIFNFRVKDENVTSNQLIGQFALPCTSMCEGYRHVHLEDSRGQRLERATLFVHVQLAQYTMNKKCSSAK